MSGGETFLRGWDGGGVFAVGVGLRERVSREGGSMGGGGLAGWNGMGLGTWGRVIPLDLLEGGMLGDVALQMISEILMLGTVCLLVEDGVEGVVSNDCCLDLLPVWLRLSLGTLELARRKKV